MNPKDKAESKSATEPETVRQETLKRRMEILAQLAAERGSRVLTLIHRREPWEAADWDKSMGIEDTEVVLREIRRTPPETPIDLILHTPGGLVLAAEMIAMALNARRGKVTVIVPFYAMSGGTLLALAASEILMESYAVLGPLDPQIAGLPSPALVWLVRKKPLHLIQDQTLILAQIAELALAQMCGFICWLLGSRMEQERARRTAAFLTQGYLAHSSPITFEKARELGLPVKLGVPDLVYELFETCCHGQCLRPGIGLLAGPVAVSPPIPHMPRRPTLHVSDEL